MLLPVVSYELEIPDKTTMNIETIIGFTLSSGSNKIINLACILVWFLILDIIITLKDGKEKEKIFLEIRGIKLLF